MILSINSVFNYSTKHFHPEWSLGFSLVIITSVWGGSWVTWIFGVKSNCWELVVVKLYLCMRDAKKRNNSVNAKDFPRQSRLPEKRKKNHRSLNLLIIPQFNVYTMQWGIYGQYDCHFLDDSIKVNFS